MDKDESLMLDKELTNLHDYMECQVKDLIQLSRKNSIDGMVENIKFVSKYCATRLNKLVSRYPNFNENRKQEIFKSYRDLMESVIEVKKLEIRTLGE